VFLIIQKKFKPTTLKDIAQTAIPLSKEFSTFFACKTPARQRL